MTNPYRALIQRLADELQEYINYAPIGPCDQEQALVDEARALLAQPEPVAPTDEEIMELMPQQMRDDLAAAARAQAGFDNPQVMAVFRIILNRHAVDHARAVLARWGNHPEFPDSSDGPAVPEGREPVSVVSEPSDREPLEEGPSLEEVEELCEEHCFNVEGYESIECLQGLINDALARWGTPNQAEIGSSLGAAPAPAAEGEVGELVEFLRIYGDEVMDEYGDVGEHDQLTRAAALLERLSAAALAVVPVPVSERLPGDELCWWYEPDEDDDGSGYGGNWTLLRIRGGVSCYTHWLPATALPLPAGEGEP